MEDGIRFSELLAYTEHENHRWKEWFREHPQAITLPCDIAGGPTVHELLLHVFVTDLYFAHRVSGLELPDFKALPHATLDELFAIGEAAAGKFRKFMDIAYPKDWDEVFSLGFADRTASKRKMMTQALLHGVHHRAQLASLLRQQGFKQDWIHDIILSDIIP
jgi:uncharacterized damage-inducible protein DinB